MYEEEIERRFISLYEIFVKLNEQLNWGDKIFINKALLHIAVKSYFKDIERYKAFHGTERADQHKKAAFTIKWLAKIRPVTSRVGDSNLTEDEILANSIYSLISGLCFLDIDIEEISSKLFENLLYTCQYRDIECIQFATTMYLLEKSMNRKKA